MSKKKILCIGAAHVDYTFKPLKTLINHTSNPITSEMNYGGVIRNVSENLGRLDMDVTLLSLMGNDHLGKQLSLDMQEMMKVEVDFMDDMSTAQYYAVINNDGQMDIAFADMSIYDLLDKQWIESKEYFIQTFDLIVADLNIQKSGIEALISITNESKTQLILIGVSEPKMSHLPLSLKGVDLFICNLDEAKAFFQLNEYNTEKLSHLWGLTNIRRVIMTNGANDLYIYDRDEEMTKRKVPTLMKDEIVNVTGAGDAFSAGVIYGIIKENDIENAIRYGVSNAKMTIGSRDSVLSNLTVKKLLMEANKHE